jgi:hypothetical protein
VPHPIRRYKRLETVTNSLPAESVAYRDDRGERIEQVPTQIKIDGECIAVRGHLRIASASEPDEYHPYFDTWKLRDGKIVEYNIAYDI